MIENNYLNDVVEIAGTTTCYNDITSGSNDNTSITGLYNAHNGFDQCTGLGSIIGTNLVKVMN